jgi:hypothetical protein
MQSLSELTKEQKKQVDLVRDKAYEEGLAKKAQDDKTSVLSEEAKKAVLDKAKKEASKVKETMELNSRRDRLKAFHVEGRRDAWVVRRRRIVQTLYLSGADIFCLQEVQAGVGLQSSPIDIKEFKMENLEQAHGVAVAAHTKDLKAQMMRDADAAFTFCTDWLYRYKKRSVIADILKTDMKIYNDVRSGIQPINMKLCDIFHLAACDDPSGFPATVTRQMLRDFGLRGNELDDFLKSLQQEQGFERLNKCDKVLKLIAISNTLGLSGALRPWLHRSTISEVMDIFHICDDDLCSEDDRHWCASVLSLTDEEREVFQRQAVSRFKDIEDSIKDASKWRETLTSNMENKQRLGYPGEVLLWFRFGLLRI